VPKSILIQMATSYAPFMFKHLNGFRQISMSPTRVQFI